MISNPELENIIEVISIPDGTLEDCFNQFIKHFPQDQFRACCVLINLMNSNVLTQSHRIIAIYLIIESFKQENIKINPFSMNLIEIFEKSDCHYERKFIYNYFVKNVKELSKVNVKSLINEIELTDSFKVPDDFQSFKKYVFENIPHIPGLKGTEIKTVISDFGLADNNKYIPPNQSIPVNKIDLAEVSLQGFQPDFIRPIPTPLEISEDEAYWLNPGIVADFAWDFNMCVENKYVGEVKELWQKAFKTTLSETETKILNETLDKDPKLVFKFGMTPQLLPPLVEKNAPVATTVLLKLMPSSQIPQYLEKLVEMELSLASLEVVNKVVYSTELPKEFLTLYITNCISHCEENKKDKVLQGRLVRLVCVFIKSLIKGKIINPREMYIELQAFCIEFSKINEANQLFKMLKGLDSGGSEKEK